MPVHSKVPQPVRLPTDVLVRPARRRDYPAIRRILRDAYREYAASMPPPMFKRYLLDLVDLDRHARLGTLLVAEVDGRICGSASFYPEASRQELGWPAGWAGGRGLAVHRAARHHGVARALIAECERRAREVGAPVFAFHTTPFMTRAVSLYDGLGYVRAPEYDLDLGRIFGFSFDVPPRAVAYRKDLT
ncbi:MAG: GNAT family N-acetyltransferase [Nocardioides sp.]